MITAARVAFTALSVTALLIGPPSCCKSAKRLEDQVSGAPETPRGVVLEVPVPGDRDVYFVRGTGTSKRVILYLPPRCEEVVSTLKNFGPAASSEGSLVMLMGDQECPGSTFRHFSPDVTLIARRFDAAIDVLSRNHPGDLDAGTVTVIGYSEGAARAEDVVAHAPQRFSRAILIGAPDAPRAATLAHARAVATMAGEHDRRDLMMVGVQSLTAIHVPAKFFLLPGANHGEFGPEGGRVVTEALAWLLQAAP